VDPTGARATALGGSDLMPLIPGFITGPRRGRVVISAALADRPGTLFHELFHTFESYYGIRPVHGYLPDQRGHFSHWQGQGEFDYYRYHLAQLPQEPRPFAFRYRYPSQPRNQLFTQAQGAWIALTPAQRASYEHWRAQALAKDVPPPSHSQRSQAYSQALGIYAFDWQVLLAAASHEHFHGQRLLSYDYIRQAYALNPQDPGVCYFMAVAHLHQNQAQAALHYLDQALEHGADPQQIAQYRQFVISRL
jgi:hypothetical protein